MIRFEQRKTFGGVLQPGDGTRYEMVVFDDGWGLGSYEVVVLNEGFFDCITFLKRDFMEGIPYRTFRGAGTNPWTAKAAHEMLLRYLGLWKGGE